MLVPMWGDFDCLNLFQEILSFLLPFYTLSLACLPHLPLRRKLPVNNAYYEVCTDQEVCHGHSYFCLWLLLLDKM